MIYHVVVLSDNVVGFLGIVGGKTRVKKVGGTAARKNLEGGGLEAKRLKKAKEGIDEHLFN